MQDNNVLKIIANHPELLGAVRQVIEDEFSLDDIKTTMTNEAMGQIVRARISGMDKIEKAFKKIEQYKTFADKPRGDNPAR